MKKSFLMLSATALAARVSAATLCGGSSAGIMIDTTSGLRVPNAIETIVFSTEWNNSADAIISLEGVALTNATGSGALEIDTSLWIEGRVYSLVHDDGVEQLAAQFEKPIPLPFVTDDEAPWRTDDEVCPDGAASMRSGAIGPAEEGGRTSSTLAATVVGEGTGSFWWKVSSEPSYFDEYYDFLSFAIDGVEQALVAGEPGWAKVDFSVVGAGEHTLSWTFSRDDFDEPDAVFENAGWVAGLEWNSPHVTVAFDGNGCPSGEVLAAVTMHAGCRMALPGPGALEWWPDYTFGGWSDGAATYQPGDTFVFGVADVTLRAVWLEKTWPPEECVNASNLVFATGGAAEWFADFSTNHDGMVSLRSGMITHSEESWLSATAKGAGELTFWWKASGQMNGSRLYDYVKFELDGTLTDRIGDGDWTKVTVTVTDDGEHTFKWTYLKNASVDAGFDCVWLDEVCWTPAGEAPTATQTTPVPVPYVWLDKYGLGGTIESYETAAKATAANGGNTVWECYVAGLDPTKTGEKFRTVISLAGDEVQIGWEPKLLPEEEALRTYTIFGREKLDEGTWTTPATSSHRFFKVSVQMK